VARSNKSANIAFDLTKIQRERLLFILRQVLVAEGYDVEFFQVSADSLAYG
jgi:hypothetical protein